MSDLPSPPAYERQPPPPHNLTSEVNYSSEDSSLMPAFTQHQMTFPQESRFISFSHIQPLNASWDSYRGGWVAGCMQQPSPLPTPGTGSETASAEYPFPFDWGVVTSTAPIHLNPSIVSIPSPTSLFASTPTSSPAPRYYSSLSEVLLDGGVVEDTGFRTGTNFSPAPTDYFTVQTPSLSPDMQTILHNIQDISFHSPQLTTHPLSPLIPHTSSPSLPLETSNITSTQLLNTSTLPSSTPSPSPSTKRLSPNPKRTPLSRPHTCPHCPRTFHRLHNLTSHIPTHFPRAPHTCPHCPSHFQRRHDLTRHVRAKHSLERPYKCHACDAAFSRLDSWKKHWEFEERKLGGERGGVGSWVGE